MPIVIVPQLSDNYAYLLIDDSSKECAVVDCAEADKVIAAAKLHGAKIVAVLTTHWHHDTPWQLDAYNIVPDIDVKYLAGDAARKIAEHGGRHLADFLDFHGALQGRTLFDHVQHRMKITNRGRR